MGLVHPPDPANGAPGGPPGAGPAGRLSRPVSILHTMFESTTTEEPEAHAALLQPLPVSTHAGLDDFDPWLPPPRPSVWRTLWPWGLAQVSETLEVIALAIVMFVAVPAGAQTLVVPLR